jgi:agmatinase
MTAATLFGWPRPDGQALAANHFRAFGVPADQGNGVSRGAARAPAAVREAASLRRPPALPGVDEGDIANHGGLSVEHLLARVGAAVEHCLDAGSRPLIIGGDHAISYAPIAALQQRGAIGVVWFDAHTDFSPWHGTPGHSHKQVLRRVEALEGVRRIVQVGYRGFTAGDESQLGEKAQVITARRAAAMSGDALAELLDDSLRWYVSIDIDVVDPFHAPGTSAPVPGGIVPSHLVELVAAIARQRRIAGADVVEVNPRLDVDGMTSSIAATLLHTIADLARRPGTEA